jgi:hypothetical protein
MGESERWEGKVTLISPVWRNEEDRELGAVSMKAADRAYKE